MTYTLLARLSTLGTFSFNKAAEALVAVGGYNIPLPILHLRCSPQSTFSLGVGKTFLFGKGVLAVRGSLPQKGYFVGQRSSVAVSIKNDSAQASGVEL